MLGDAMLAYLGCCAGDAMLAYLGCCAGDRARRASATRVMCSVMCDLL